MARIVVKTWVPRYFPEDNARPYVKDTLSEYDLRYLKGDTWVRLVSVEGNDKEVREHTFEAIRTDKIRLTSRRGLCVAEIEAYGPAR